MPSLSIPAALVGGALSAAGSGLGIGGLTAAGSAITAAGAGGIGGLLGIGAGAAAGGATSFLGLAGDAAAAGGAGLSLPSLSTLGTVAGVGGSVLQGVSAINQANYQKQLATVESEQLNNEGNAAAAAGERQQQQLERQNQLALSRAQAVAGASGGGASDPTVLNVEGQIAQQGQYNALTALYNGQSQAAADRYQGQIDLFQANQAVDAAPFAALGSVLSGVSSLASNRAMLRYYNSVGSF